MVKKFYVTTPIYYINAKPTVGSAYTTIVADILARWHRLKGEKVFFLTGTDENSVKTVNAAKEADYKDIQKYIDDMAKKWIGVWKKLGIKYDGFIRTTEDRHKKFAKEFFLKMKKKGDIYKDKYEGLYCNDCEAFLTEKDLIEGKCPNHKTKPKLISEDNYFFKLSKYQDKLLKYIKNNPGFVQPKDKRNEVVSFIKQGLKDISISRENLEWGINIPGEKNMKFWCWTEAILNYISGAEGNWPSDVCLIGKDILKFHAIYFPAFLFSAGYKLPKTIFAHGFFTINGEKMGKSLGNAIDPLYISKKYGNDSLRYFLIREIHFGKDGDFSEAKLKDRLNNELANDLGNLVSRVLSIASKFDGKISGEGQIKLEFKKINKLIEQNDLTSGLSEIWHFVNKINRYVNEKEPWKLKGKELGEVLYTLLECIRIVSVLLYPFIPRTSEKICKQLGVKLGDFSDLKYKKFSGKIKKGEHLFRKI